MVQTNQFESSDPEAPLLEKAVAFVFAKGRSHYTAETFARGMNISHPAAEQLIAQLIDGEVLGATREPDGYRVLPAEEIDEDAGQDDAADTGEGVAVDEITPTNAPDPADVPSPPPGTTARRAGRIETVQLDQIDPDPLFSLRDERNLEAVQDYAADMARGDSFPRPLLTKAADRYRVIDGDHRCQARRLAGLADVEAEILEGQPHELLVEAIRANRRNGVRFTRGELNAALDRCLADPMLRQWADTVLADLVGVSDRTVGRRRQELNVDKVEENPRKQIRNGKVVEAKMPTRKPANEAVSRTSASGGTASAEAEEAAASEEGSLEVAEPDEPERAAESTVLDDLEANLAQLHDLITTSQLASDPGTAERARHLVGMLRSTADQLAVWLEASSN